MKSNRKDNRKQHNESTRMELKYCEHCGSLWLRESGAETVYCERCQPEVAELPAAKKRPGRVTLPVGNSPVIDDYRSDSEEFEFEAAGGVA
jgi:hypothetical protein